MIFATSKYRILVFEGWTKKGIFKANVLNFKSARLLYNVVLLLYFFHRKHGDFEDRDAGQQTFVRKMLVKREEINPSI